MNLDEDNTVHVTMTTIEVSDKIDSVSSFLDSLFRVRAALDDQRLFYRGHSQGAEYALKPTVGRADTYNNYVITANQEERLLERFTRLAYQHLQRPLTTWEALFLARHHGLPTRILDWTRSPLVALFFACAANPERDAHVWACRHRKSARADRANTICTFDADDNPLELYRDKCNCSKVSHDSNDAVKVVYPLYNSPRILAQQGVFTLHTRPEKALDSYANMKMCPTRMDVDTIVLWSIEKEKKRSIGRELESLGIDNRVLFPDLDGLAKSLRETLVMWNDPICKK